MTDSIPDQIRALHSQFAAKTLTSVAHSRKREALLQKGLVAIAQSHGVNLSAVGIDANGEFRLKANPEGNTHRDREACGPFKTFAEVLNKHNPRCGMQPPAILEANSGWCMINHFDVERLILAN
jgi:hypothetical protein